MKGFLIKMIDNGYIWDIVKEIVDNPSITVSNEKLKGDASNRTYYRIHIKGDSNLSSLIMMELAEPEAFKKSEEKVSVSKVQINELPYINILNHLALCNVRVPRLYYYDKKTGLLFLEDFGDVLFQTEVTGKDKEVYRRYYIKAIDELLKLQVEGTRRKNSSCIAFGRTFDRALLMWEFDHFIEYRIEDRGIKIKDKDKKIIRKYFQDISEKLSKEPQYFTHRDYHSRNLMICNGEVCVLDFQDALLGPCQYDLASLLRDSYMDIPEELVDEFIEYYIQKKEGIEGTSLDRDAFRELFDLMSIQRNLKAAGRFCYINSVKKNPNFLQYIPRTLRNVKRNLGKYPYLEELRNLLARYCPELSI